MTLFWNGPLIDRGRLYLEFASEILHQILVYHLLIFGGFVQDLTLTFNMGKSYGFTLLILASMNIVYMVTQVIMRIKNKRRLNQLKKKYQEELKEALNAAAIKKAQEETSSSSEGDQSSQQDGEEKKEITTDDDSTQQKTDFTSIAKKKEFKEDKEESK